MNFYIYYNWQAKKNIGTIHKENCGHCNYGRGKRVNANVGQNGVWIGPFATRRLAEEFCTRIGIIFRLCCRCNP